MSNELINIDTQPIADVANNLINKLAAGCGWFVNRKTDESRAKSVLIEEIKSSQLTPLEKVALISNSKKILKEYCNQEKIVNIALKKLNDCSKPELIEDDWLNLFMDKARLVSNEDVQLLWGKILAEESIYKGSISRQLLNILSMMDRESAETFTSLCQFSFCLYGSDGGHDRQPLILYSLIDQYFSKYNISMDALRTLESLGLIEVNYSFDDFSYTARLDKGYYTHIVYGNNRLDFSTPTKEIMLGSVILKKAGRELANIIDANISQEFWEVICYTYITGCLGKSATSIDLHNLIVDIKNKVNRLHYSE